MAALAGVFHSRIDHQMHRWKLLPEPERLTELYFTQPNNLPSRYTPGATQTVSFTTHNLEYRTTTYNYKIVEASQDTSQSQTLSAGSFTLPQNAYKQQSVTIPTADFGQHVKIEVMLTGQNESIDYLLTKAAS